ncbi:photoreceptor disk component PRCD [Struthio camelus]|uniref:photoreceptor disk component PRCD n=1 Tax=Struthio camelus TaxID=8801 RepID=UPI00360405E4
MQTSPESLQVAPGESSLPARACVRVGHSRQPRPVKETLHLSSLWERCEGPAALHGDGGRAMCTTILLISTLVVMLRRRFFNKVEPHPEGEEEPRREAGSDPRASDLRE